MARRSGREKRVVSAVAQLPWRALGNPYAPIEVLSADQVEQIIDAALHVLETHGMGFLKDESRRLLRAAGAAPAPTRNNAITSVWCRASRSSLRKAAVRSRRWICHPRAAISICISRNCG
ncbi:MAG: trimethylamine methyltransferase family protein [Pseudomonadales bacterium]|nr:trimethylamine methyltransferase family protein [Pseudomonadales bacterium]